VKQSFKKLLVYFFLATSLVVTGASAQKLLIPVPLAPPPTPGDASLAPTFSFQDAPDPERWTTDDVTLDEQFSTAKKETMAAYQIALDTCKLEHASDQPACIAQAKAEMEKEMSLIKARFGILK